MGCPTPLAAGGIPMNSPTRENDAKSPEPYDEARSYGDFIVPDLSETRGPFIWYEPGSPGFPKPVTPPVRPPQPPTQES